MNSEPPKRPFFPRLVRNWVSLIGVILIVAFALLCIAVGGKDRPYDQERDR